MTEIHLVRDPADPIGSSGPIDWAVERLADALRARSIAVRQDQSQAHSEDEDALDLLVCGANTPNARTALAAAGVAPPDAPESLAILPARRESESDTVVCCGADVRGLVYGVLELADRIEHATDIDAALAQPTVERPANSVRSVMRLFCSEVEDKPWLHDEAFWHRYLSMLAAQRFNRFSLTLGLGYNYHWHVTDAYLYFAYPFLVSVPGYDVRVPQLPDEERERNMTMLRFISDQTAARGLDFQLGLWTHAYQWIDSPDAHHTIEGLTPQTHAAYCRDALRTLLESCPSISGVTLRIHGESGVPEGSWEFWRTVFDGVAGCGRRVGLDLHAKGLDHQTLDAALGTDLPLTVSTKFWAEHMGLPYHQMAIRESERPVREDPSERSTWHRYMKVSEGSRPFTRYGYGDFLREDRQYDLVYRLWPGTQRLLLWGDPAMAAAYGRAASLAGAQGIEWFEPLTFKGREGTGVAGDRTGYADPSLTPSDDWEKYAYAYRLFGRLTYDPNASSDVWQRALRPHFDAASTDAESALASASRILPLLTVAYHPSASNNYYWPELYTDLPIAVDEHGSRPHYFDDMAEPRRFGTVSPLDPEVFSSIAEFVQELRLGQPSGRISPLQVAHWLDELAADATQRIDAVQRAIAEPTAEVRRWLVDVRILAALGRFFATKLTAGLRYEWQATTPSRQTLESAIDAGRAARSAWQQVVNAAGSVYAGDLTYGPQPWLRGHWADRLPAIDADLAELERRLPASGGPDGGRPFDEAAVLAQPQVDVDHLAPASFRPDTDLPIAARIGGPNGSRIQRMSLRYRPMNQALEYRTLDMDRSGPQFTTRIPGSDLDGAYPLAYVFVLQSGETAWRYPSLGADLTGQPYYVIRPGSSG